MKLMGGCRLHIRRQVRKNSTKLNEFDKKVLLTYSDKTVKSGSVEKSVLEDCKNVFTRYPHPGIGALVSE